MEEEDVVFFFWGKKKRVFKRYLLDEVLWFKNTLLVLDHGFLVFFCGSEVGGLQFLWGPICVWGFLKQVLKLHHQIHRVQWCVLLL